MALRLSRAFATAVLLSFLWTGARPAFAQCDLNSARLFARIFILANPVLAENLQPTRGLITDPHPALVAAVRSGPEYFEGSSIAIQCGKALGAILTARGVQSFNPHAYADVMNRFGGSEFTPQVAQSLNQGAAFFINLGQEVTWLSQVLPSAALGDWAPYVSTGPLWRQMIRQGLPAFNQAKQMTSNPLIGEIYYNMLAQVSPYMEQQIVVLALINASSGG